MVYGNDFDGSAGGPVVNPGAYLIVFGSVRGGTGISAAVIFPAPRASTAAVMVSRRTLARRARNSVTLVLFLPSLVYCPVSTTF